MKMKWVGVGALLSGVLASLCCVGPVALAAIGLSGAGLGAPFRPFFMGLTGVLLGLAFYSLYWKKTGTACEEESCPPVSGKKAKAALWVVTLFVLGLWPLPYVGALNGTEPIAFMGEKISLQCSGMFCASCVTGIEKALKNVPGVNFAEVNFEAKEAVVYVEPGKMNHKSLIEAVKSAGPYQAEIKSNERKGS